jgi:glyoxylase-like metal-dependent hydrolase (beta-lactamase superfamily II)
VLVELKQSSVDSRQSSVDSRQSSVAPGVEHPLSGTRLSAPVIRYPLGDMELISVSDGFFRLDGGAMFGVVPKPLWAPKAPPDERNRITLAMRPLVVRGVRTMIIDAGVGDKETAKFGEIYGLDRSRHLDHTLAEAGLSVADIDVVLATHLHFDHAGGFTVRGPDGRVRPRFPRAQYVVRRGEWEDATHPNERNRASYFADNYVPLAEAGVLQLVDDDQTIMPGVRVRRTGGHTMHHQIVTIESGGKAAAYLADLIPTTAHVPDAWIMGYDLYPLDTLASKKTLVQEAVEREMLIFFEHDPSVAAGYIRHENGKPRVIPH